MSSREHLSLQLLTPYLPWYQHARFHHGVKGEAAMPPRPICWFVALTA